MATTKKTTAKKTTVKKTATKKAATKKAATKKATTKKTAAKKTSKKAVKKSAVKKEAENQKPVLPPETPMTELLGESFLTDLVSDWQSNGAGVIEECRISKPEAYLRLIAAYAPKELRKQLRPFGNIPDETLLKELQNVLKELQELGIETSPGAGA